MKTIKKLLYLLQLEEYQNDRYLSWLKKFKIEQLEERKNKLRLSVRVIFILLMAIPFLPFLKKEKSLELANQLITPIFSFLEETIILLAKLKLKLYPNLTKVVITGSYGKTSFKEMLAWAIETKYSVLKTPGNINTRIGIAKIILSKLGKTQRVFIAETGAYRKSEIEKICRLIRPDIGIITVIGWMHLERFENITNIRQAKFEIIKFIKDKKLLFIPKEDHQFINYQKTIVKIGEILGLNKKLLENRIRQFGQVNHRLEIKEINKNMKIIDDTYNSNPLGFRRALEELKNFPSYQKIVVTPGMIELGDRQFKLNRELAVEASRISDILVIVGETNKLALTPPPTKKNRARLFYLGAKENLEEIITSHLRPPTVILLENELPDHYF